MSTGEVSELQVATERSTDRHPKLLYHGTQDMKGSPKEQLMVEYGLLASKTTLTPSLELAADFAVPGGKSLLTFWYPQNTEVQKIYGGNDTQPDLLLTDASKAEIADRISTLNLDEHGKKIMLSLIGKAKTVLPSSRLGAVADMGYFGGGSILSSLPSHDNSGFLKKHTEQRDDLVSEIEAALGNLEIRFIDPNLTVHKLAEDMVRTDLEHYLIEIGQSIAYAKANIQKPKVNQRGDRERLEKKLEMLKSVRFTEPVYERYRNILISRIAGFLNPSSTEMVTAENI